MDLKEVQRSDPSAGRVGAGKNSKAGHERGDGKVIPIWKPKRPTSECLKTPRHWPRAGRVEISAFPICKANRKRGRRAFGSGWDQIELESASEYQRFCCTSENRCGRCSRVGREKGGGRQQQFRQWRGVPRMKRRGCLLVPRSGKRNQTLWGWGCGTELRGGG